MQTHELKPPAGSKRNRKRIARGDGSGHGTTAGRGSKGQNSRSGGRTRPFFEGGQMPLFRRLPKRGFKPPRRTRYAIVNLASLDGFDGGAKITPDELKAARLIPNNARRVKILAKGELSKSLTVHAHQFSTAAAEAIRAAGGEIEVLE